MRPGQLVVLELTTYPGTTREIVKPILEATGLDVGQPTSSSAISPEREDPGNASLSHHDDPEDRIGRRTRCRSASSLRSMVPFVGQASFRSRRPTSPRPSKITENIFRAVNIALVNELKMIFDAMGIDVWEVIEAAKTKPFGYMPFYPGPGLGGHCIPIDPFYLTWKSREFGLPTRFIELAGEINHRHAALRHRETRDARSSRTSGVALEQGRAF